MSLGNYFMLSSLFHTRILENLSTAVFLINRKQEIIYTNPAASMLLQTSQKRILSSQFIHLFLQFDQKLVNEFSAIVDSGHSYTQRECQFVLQNGRSLLADCSVASNTIDDVDYLMVEMQSTDRLIRISREEQLQENQETAEILIRGLAHEIKNPLGGIRGAAQLLDAELTVDDHHDYTRVIMDESDRLRNLVDRMLGSNKALNRNHLNIHEILERVCSLIHAESGGSIIIKKDYDPSIPDLNGDKGQLIQAFLNIAKNALQALSKQIENKADATISIRTRTLRQFTIGHYRHRLVAKIEIIDNGPGISKDFIQNIFYPMISGRADGTGLGLSITQSIFTKHNGLVECESKPGATNFIVYLPLELKHEC
ncbi:MAG: two-component system nitrogen regulation sensor histidine kinase GlnL [Oleiphilaceae bacterium]|jgi:two-component system nitrogen regulation sensor histidine kinase GlnL